MTVVYSMLSTSSFSNTCSSAKSPVTKGAVSVSALLRIFDNGNSFSLATGLEKSRCKVDFHIRNRREITVP